MTPSGQIHFPSGVLPFEFDSLAKAVNYQRWVFETAAPFIGNRVLEIGAGIGNMSRWLPVRERLILTETEPQLVEYLKDSMPERHRHDPKVSVIPLNVLDDDLAPLLRENLDTVVSFNVLEHIEDDAAVFRKLRSLVLASRAPGPRRVVTFVPAHPWAYGTIDRKHGHYRRYSKSGLLRLCRKVAPEAKARIQHFNLFGLPGWILHGRILRIQEISAGPVALFDRLCPYLAPIDNFLHRVLKVPLGQSLLAVLEWS